jgi:hypothetical protein
MVLVLLLLNIDRRPAAANSLLFLLLAQIPPCHS